MLNQNVIRKTSNNLFGESLIEKTPNDNNTVRGATTTTENYEHISQLKKGISPEIGSNKGKKTNHSVINGGVDFGYEELYANSEYAGLTQDDKHEQQFALILVIFSLSIFVGIFYISSSNLKVEYTTVNMPVGIKE